jgi:signal transduction histidine kinase
MQFSKNTTKIIASYLLLISLLVLVAGAGIFSISELRKATTKVINQELAIGVAANNVRFSISRVRQKEKSLFISIGRPLDPKRNDNLQQEIDGFNKYVALLLVDIETLSKYPLPQDATATISKMPDEARHYQKAVNDIFQDILNGSITSARQADEALIPFKKFIRDNRTDVQNILDSAKKNLSNATMSVEDSAIKIERLILTLSIFAIVIGITAAIFTSRKLAISERQVLTLNHDLEERVEERTKLLSLSNEELQRTLDNLQSTKDELIRSEKLAVLGSLVAGVAHELNTPIGNARLAASTLADASHHFVKHAEEKITRSALQGFLEAISLGSDLVERNLVNAVELISSFKRVAVDQASYQRRTFLLDEAVHEIVLALGPSLRGTPVQLIENIPLGIVMNSYPGPLGQVIINLANNARLHGLRDRQKAYIEISAELLGSNEVAICVCDDGEGIQPEILSRIFEPFFTTRKNEGGSGLGLSIVQGLVQDLLAGRINVESVLGKGTTFRLVLPLQAPQAQSPSASSLSSSSTST